MLGVESAVEFEVLLTHY